MADKRSLAVFRVFCLPSLAAAPGFFLPAFLASLRRDGGSVEATCAILRVSGIRSLGSRVPSGVDSRVYQLASLGVIIWETVTRYTRSVFSRVMWKMNH